MARDSLHPEAQQVENPKLKPKPPFWKEYEWEERTEVPAKARRKLSTIDHNLYVCMNLACLLADNDNAVVFASGDEDSPVRPLPFDQRAAVVMAMKNLLAESSDLSDDLRNDGRLWGERE